MIKKTGRTILGQTTANFSNDITSSKEVRNVTLTEEFFELDADGNLVNVSSTTTNLTGTFQQERGVLGSIKRSVVKVESTRIGSNVVTDEEQLNEIAESNPVIAGLSALIKSPNREALITQNPSLPGLSTQDRTENTIDDFLLGLGSLGNGNRSTGGLEKLVPNDFDGKTTLKFPLESAEKASDRLFRLSFELPKIKN